MEQRFVDARCRSAFENVQKSRPGKKRATWMTVGEIDVTNGGRVEEEIGENVELSGTAKFGSGSSREFGGRIKSRLGTGD